MKRQRIKIALLPCLLVLLVLVTAGTWSANDFFYQPSMGARGADEKNHFDSGLERVDAHLGKYKTLGDPQYGTLSEALTTIGTETKVTLTIPAGAVPITTNTTIPANIALKILKGGQFNINNEVTLTINGPVEAGPYQIFSCTGTGKVSGLAKCPELIPEWWGAAGDGTTDDTVAVNAAKTAAVEAGTWLRFLPSKTYAIDQLVIDADNTLINAYGSKLLHNGSNKPLVFIDPGNPGGGSLDNIKWLGGTLMAKQSATNPTTAVMYLRQVWHGKFSDIEIFCGEDGQRGQWIYQTTPYADYGMHFYSAWTETGGSDGQVQFNAFSNISIFGAKQAGVFFDGTPGEIDLTTQQTLPSLTVGNYLRGGTSKSTARIVAIDASNNRIFLDRWHGCYFSSGQGPFITGETLCETTQRDDGGAGTWDTGKYANNSASKAFTANLIGAVDNGFHELETKGCNIGVYTLVGRNNFYGGEIHGSNTSNPNIYSESSARNRFYGVKAENSSVNDVKVEYGYWNRGKNVYFSSTGGIPDDDTKRMHAVFSTYEYTYLYRTEFYGPDPQQTFYAPVSTTEVFRGRTDGDTNWRFIMRAAGDLRWGDGSNAVDVELRRSSANVLELAPGDVFRLDRVRFNPLSCAPSPTTDGDVAYADGTGWNPGSGAGLYVRTGGAWVKLH